MSEQGRKYDGGKLRYDLIPVLALEEMVKGLTYGTIKYDDNNWVKVPEGRKRYMAAALRHIQEYRKGNLWDEEQDIHHLAAAMNNLSFIVEKDLRGWEDSSEQQIGSEEEFFDRGKQIAKALDIHTHKNPFSGSDISQEELKSFIESVDNPASQEELWYPPVEECENPWIEWNLGIMPTMLCGEELVEILMKEEREAKEFSSDARPAQQICWDNDGCSWDIVAYRIVD